MIKIREFREADTNFVISTWLKSFYSNQTGYKEKRETFFSGHQKQIKKLWSEGKLLCYVAHDPSDEDVILGFAVFGTDYSLHYTCVKEMYKRLGVCKALLSHFYKSRDEITVTHWTKDIQNIKKLYRVNYNKYKFYC